jgi:hypothetical protein
MCGRHVATSLLDGRLRPAGFFIPRSHHAADDIFCLTARNL